MVKDGAHPMNPHIKLVLNGKAQDEGRGTKETSNLELLPSSLSSIGRW